MAEAEAAELSQLAEQTLSHPIKPSAFKYCPSLDLLALGTHEEKVHVYRLNGQRVLSTTSRNPGAQVKRIQWKPNGAVRRARQLLAIAYSDGYLRIFSPESTKQIHEIKSDISPAGGNSAISCLGWGSNITNYVAAPSNTGLSDPALESLLHQAAAKHSSNGTLDLPRELALLEVEGALPKLSLLPAGKNDDVFSSRPSMDALFHPSRASGEEAVDVLVIGSDDGVVHLSIYDSFVIGTFKLEDFSKSLRGCKPVGHASHPRCSAHALLIEGHGRISFLPMNLRFLLSFGEYLSLLVAKSTQLQSLLRYINQVQSLIQSEWKTSQELPRKFIRSIEGDLEDKYQISFVHAVHHLTVTGHCFPALKEWLVDVLSERGHKRWDKAIGSGYERVRRLTHELLFPAIERCAVLASRLRGVSKYHHSNAALGLSTENFNHILDAVSCLTILAHDILHSANAEHRQFATFSAWLRREIDAQATDPTSGTDPPERDLDLDYSKILGYMQGPMLRSKLNRLLQETPSNVGRGKFSASEGPMLLHRFKEDLAKLGAGLPLKGGPLSLWELTSLLGYRCDIVFQQIASAQRRNVIFTTPVTLTSSEDGIITDMKMSSEGGRSTTYVAVRSRVHVHDLCVFRVELLVRRGQCSFSVIELGHLRLADGEIRDIKFADDEYLMVLSYTNGTAQILRFPYGTSKKRPHGLVYEAWASEGPLPNAFDSPPSTIFSAADMPSECVRHTFEARTFDPVQMDINGRQGRRVICVLTKSGQQYKILDLSGDEDDDDSEVGEGE
ncbi:MAG: hypothetical protein M1823_005606 [Watsoniomyces obsoletus]|nr:MAG: hypothetical protein M1823_005606 [Watsoniomyces obsoletus]